MFASSTRKTSYIHSQRLFLYYFYTFHIITEDIYMNIPTLKGQGSATEYSLEQLKAFALDEEKLKGEYEVGIITV
jgi:hypothetical protein